MRAIGYQRWWEKQEDRPKPGHILRMFEWSRAGKYNRLGITDPRRFQDHCTPLTVVFHSSAIGAGAKPPFSRPGF
jgi:hypothetical protein